MVGYHSSIKEFNDEFGKIISAKIISYWKYYFELEIKSEKGFLLHIRTGGDRDDIYRYDPFSDNWNEHLCASSWDSFTIDILSHPEQSNQ